MEVGIQQLSPAQLRKLEMGHPVRAKLGSAHIVKVSPADAKKLMSAQKKGSAATISASMAGEGLVKKSNEFSEAARPYMVNKTVSPIKQAATTSAVSRIQKGKGLVKKSNEFSEAARPYMVNKTVSPIKQAATTSAVSSISKKKKGKGAVKQVAESMNMTPNKSPVEVVVEPRRVQFGAGMCGCEGMCGCGMVDAFVTRAVMDGNGLVKSTTERGMKEFRHGKKVGNRAVSGMGLVNSSVDRGMKEFKHGKKVGNRAVSGMGEQKQLNNAPGLGWTNKRGQTMAVDPYGNKRRTEPDPDRPGHVRWAQEPEPEPVMDGGKINRLKKFDKWFKSIGSKVKTLNHNLQPIKQAATDRAVDYIKYYNNPQAQAQAAIDMAQAEASDTAKIFSKKGKRGSQSAAVGSMMQILPRVAPPELSASAPIAVDVNEDGQADGFFMPNELQYFGGKVKRKASASPWIAHVKAYAAKHGLKYGQALKEAKASYKKGGALSRKDQEEFARQKEEYNNASPEEQRRLYANQDERGIQKGTIGYGRSKKRGGALYPAGGALYPAGYEP